MFHLRRGLSVSVSGDVTTGSELPTATMERKLILNNGKIIGTHEKCFIIAEIGQNHQGDINIAKTLIHTAKV